jgi:hypothetical protein
MRAWHPFGCEDGDQRREHPLSARWAQSAPVRFVGLPDRRVSLQRVRHAAGYVVDIAAAAAVVAQCRSPRRPVSAAVAVSQDRPVHIRQLLRRLSDLTESVEYGLAARPCTGQTLERWTSLVERRCGHNVKVRRKPPLAPFRQRILRRRTLMVSCEKLEASLRTQKQICSRRWRQIA